ncbi:MAG TPA: YiiX/YebB-like N1pC/P60 family cysteine hydrolase [Bacteroidia bacterium]|jgi:hypothetical protein|nr:YiiX/YebB-like N1pC/P60 family cysteine hydrolase [Bacteroidia bacterium]
MKKILLPVLTFSLLAACGEGDKKQDDSASSNFTIDSAFAAQQLLGSKTNTDTTKATALPPVQFGDIIMQNRSDDHGKFTTAFTGSKYNNMGIIFQLPQKNLLMVLSVGDSVKAFPLTEWVAAGDGQHVALLRIKNANIYFNDKHEKMLTTELKSFRGKPYDAYSDWSDDEFYQAEMVYKGYHNALGIVLCKPEKFSTLNYHDPLTKKLFYSKYPNGMFPADMDVVTPDDIYHSQALDIIYEK